MAFPVLWYYYTNCGITPIIITHTWGIMSTFFMKQLLQLMRIILSLLISVKCRDLSYQTVDISRHWHIEALTYCGIDILRRWHIEALTHWGVDISRRWHIEALIYRGVDILRLWHIEALTYWGVDISRCWHIEALTYRGSEITLHWHIDPWTSVAEPEPPGAAWSQLF